MELSFYGLTTAEINDIFSDKNDRWNNIFVYDALCDYVRNTGNREEHDNLNFKYCSEDTFNHITSAIRNHVELSIVHMNIRSLNANSHSLIQFLALLDLQFDVIVLSEVWSTNIV